MNCQSRQTKPDRLNGIDLARAIAISGMMLEHINQVIGALPYIGSDWLVWLACQIDGRSAVLFMMLAGMGMSTMARNARLSNNASDQKTIRSKLLRRSLILFVFGLLFRFGWGADILHYFGFYIAIGSFLLFSPSRRLWIGIFMVNAGFIIALLALNDSAAWCYDAGWNWETLKYTDFWTPRGFLRNLLLNGWFPFFPWFGFLLLGIWLGRLNLNDHLVRLRCILCGFVLAIFTGIASSALVNHIGPAWMNIPYELSQALFGAAPIPPAPLYSLQASATAVCIIALCFEIVHRSNQARWLQPWLIMGQHSLSIYIGHIALLLGPLFLVGWTGNNLGITFSLSFAAIGITLLLSSLWNKRYRRGPLETIMRRLSQ